MAFVLHDMFGVPFDTDRRDRRQYAGHATPARQPRTADGSAHPTAGRRPGHPTSRPRRLHRRREDGDFEALVAVLDPDVTLRADAGPGGGSTVIRGAAAGCVPGCGVPSYRSRAGAVPVLVNGSVGLLSLRDGRPMSVFSPVVRGGRIVEINIVADPARLALLDVQEFI